MVHRLSVNGEGFRHRLLPGDREDHVTKPALARNPRFTSLHCRLCTNTDLRRAFWILDNLTFSLVLSTESTWNVVPSQYDIQLETLSKRLTKDARDLTEVLQAVIVSQQSLHVMQADVNDAILSYS